MTPFAELQRVRPPHPSPVTCMADCAGPFGLGPPCTCNAAHARFAIGPTSIRIKAWSASKSKPLHLCAREGEVWKKAVQLQRVTFIMLSPCSQTMTHLCPRQFQNGVDLGPMPLAATRPRGQADVLSIARPEARYCSAGSRTRLRYDRANGSMKALCCKRHQLVSFCEVHTGSSLRALCCDDATGIWNIHYGLQYPRSADRSTG